jgi:cellobiose epimerase
VKFKYKIFTFFLILVGFTFCSNPQEKKNLPDENQKQILITEIQKILDDEINLWYPLCIDTIYGGYFSDINYKWELDGLQNKMIVSQARHIWSASNAFMFYKDRKDLLKIAEHGFNFLKDYMWDKEYGGFYDLVDRKGNPIKENGIIIKRAYGNSFAIYGLAAYYRASGNIEALELAKKTFWWLEKNSYDPEYKGYFQFLLRTGEPQKKGYQCYPPKDQNSSIHLLECFTELYKVWPDTLLKIRLLSLQHLIRDIITTDQGYMNLFFNAEWKPVSYKDSSESNREENYDLDHVSFGHDIETAYLLLEASEIAGFKNDSMTLAKAKQMVDHTIKFGWDDTFGGFFDRGYYFEGDSKPKIIQKTKEWWAQAEALNSLLLMSSIYPDQKNYYQRFCDQWIYIKNYLIDQNYKGWFWGGIDQVPGNKFTNKGSIWKVNYHTIRSLINCLNNLKNIN